MVDRPRLTVRELLRMPAAMTEDLFQLTAEEVTELRERRDGGRIDMRPRPLDSSLTRS
jgi:hypothetical protein